MGTAPEINSLINPVRSTSAAAMIERMKAIGMDMNRADAEKLARQSKGMLLDRLQHGGQDMPAFPHLRGAEVDSLVAYLRQLANVRGAEKEQIAVREPRARVGEYIVKSTCHVCHSASGANPTPQQLYEGAIPPLNTLALRTSRAEFIRKVTYGAPILMGSPPEFHRGRMPVFYYLSDEEAADVYLYLARYPPYPWATLDSKIAATQPDQNAMDSSRQISKASFPVNAGSPGVHSTATSGNAGLGVLPVFAGFVAVTFVGLGFVFTAYELRRLSKRNEGRKRNSARTHEYRQHTSEPADHELVA
jgi:mono/diheme cytochrome c family protein